MHATGRSAFCRLLFDQIIVDLLEISFNFAVYV